MPTGKAAGQLSGIVVKGLVTNGTVTAYQVDAQLQRGAALGSATTNEAGAFTIDLPSYNGPLLIVASSGTYTEEAIGFPVTLDGHELALVVPDYKSGSNVENLRVTPVSTFVAGAASFHVQKKGADLATAVGEAWTHLNAHFGNVDWAQVVPADLSVPGVSNLSPEPKAGLILSALSYQAKMMAEESGVTPGLVVNGATLTEAFALDLAADGTFDGIGPAGTLMQSKVALDGFSPRKALAQALAAFISSDRNASSLELADVKALIDALATNSDPYLFCPNQMPGANCGSAGIDVDAPIITFLKPVDGAGVNGQVQIQVKAEDETEMESLAFIEPTAGLSKVTTTFEIEKKMLVLSAVLDASPLQDGPLTLKMVAKDKGGNVAEKSITIVVSNRGPTISIAAPGEGATVSGAVIITASASAQAGSIAKLELKDPPAGVGADQLPAADGFAASWDTTRSPEGVVQLTFHAEDTLGGVTDTTITVNVDNVALGTVSVNVSVGAPIAGATVKLVAIDDSTGLPVSGRAGGAVLGQGGPTLADGTLSFTLSQENWHGPVQLVASGSALSYVDPSDGTTSINLPSTFQLTSYIPAYKTGDALDATMTFWTSLADAAVLAYSKGSNPAQPAAVPLTQALAAVDPLFSAHVSKPVAWNVRDIHPVLLTQPPTQSLRDVVYAAFPGRRAQPDGARLRGAGRTDARLRLQRADARGHAPAGRG